MPKTKVATNDPKILKNMKKHIFQPFLMVLGRFEIFKTFVQNLELNVQKKTGWVVL